MPWEKSLISRDMQLLLISAKWLAKVSTFNKTSDMEVHMNTAQDAEFNEWFFLWLNNNIDKKIWTLHSLTKVFLFCLVSWSMESVRYKWE